MTKVGRHFIFCLLLSPPVLASARFSKENVDTIVDTAGVQSVEDFLGILPSVGGEDFLHQYVLMFHSRSRQKATFQAPRAILFSPEHEFVMTFNSEGDQIEMMQFNRQEQAFEFFEVDFSTYPPQVSSINPENCLHCHRQDPRPNWDHYPFWAGMYGGDDDLLTRHIGELTKKYGESFHETMPAEKKDDYSDLFETREGQEYMAFLRERPNHSRYSHLRHLNFKGYRAHRPGLVLTELLVNLNRKRIERKLDAIFRESPASKYAILGTVYCGVWSSGVWENYPEQREMAARDITRRIRLHEGVTGDDTSKRGRFKVGLPSDRPNLFPLEYTVEKLTGHRINDMDMSFSGIPIISDGSSINPIVSKGFVKYHLEADSPGTLPANSPLCDLLIQRTLSP